MSLQPQSEQLPINQAEFNPNVHCSEIINFVADVKDSIPDYLKKYAEDSLFTKRHPGSGKEVALPQADSIREQLTIFAEDPTFTERLKHGFIFKSDGVKTQLVSQHAGEAAGDAYIAANLEILLRAAKELNCDIVYGIYSGDETTGMFIPKSSDQKIDGQTIEQKIAFISNNYYRVDKETSPYFLDIQTMLDNTLDEDKKFQLDITHHVKAISESRLKTQEKGRFLRERSLFSAFIDLCESEQPDPGATAEMSQVIIDTLSQPRTVNPQHERYDESNELTWPQKYQELYAEAVEKYEVNDPDKFNEIKALLDLSVYEPLFPGSLEVRKFSVLSDDLENAISFKRSVRIIRLADTLMKDINTQSHLLGDNHMIATIRSVQNMLERHDVNPRQRSIKYYQHHGSFVMTVEDNQNGDSLFNKVSSLVEDSIELNKDIYLEEIQYGRLLDSNRAKPFIVATTHIIPSLNPDDKFKPVTIKDHSQIESFFEKDGILDILKYHQTNNETWEALKASNIGTTLPRDIVGLGNPNRNIDAPTIEQILMQLDILLQIGASIYPRYITVRPGRTEYFNENNRRLTARYRLESLRESTEPRERN
jgi:hypothetical protein